MRRIGVAVAVLTSLVAVVLAPTTAALASTDTGFSVPFSWTSPVRVPGTNAGDGPKSDQPAARTAARRCHRAEQIGLDKHHTLTEAQFLEFISGGGNKGDKASAALADRSVQIFINTTGNPLRAGRG